MDKHKLIKKIIEKKIYSRLPLIDVKLAFKKNNNNNYTDEEKVKKTRELLGKIYSAFSGQRLMTRRKLSVEEVLKRHRSTRERLPYYSEIYKRVFNNIHFKSIVDLGAGVNGFTYALMPNGINYIGVEGVGQFVDLTNDYFKEEKIKGKVHHFSLFELDRVKRLVKKQPEPRIALLFKVIDGLEILQRNYSKELINEIISVVSINDKIVVSFATKSFEKRRSFHAQRNWLVNFIKERFMIIDDFELGGERYLVFGKG
ncbi:hypothetical protein J4225_01735 [Candidatus Pacearchaeota archaeon]|nr:hypothetical protein [Candidatus Pacearchaeota archaeon]